MNTYFRNANQHIRRNPTHRFNILESTTDMMYRPIYRYGKLPKYGAPYDMHTSI